MVLFIPWRVAAERRAGSPAGRQPRTMPTGVLYPLASGPEESGAARINWIDGTHARERPGRPSRAANPDRAAADFFLT
jgi:hypothetical protein